MRVFFGTGGLGSCGQRRLQFFPIWCAKRPGTRGLDVFASKSIVQEIITCAFSSGLGDWPVVARGDFNFFLCGEQNTKHNHENTNAVFDSNLVVEGVLLEFQSLSSLLKNF